MQNFTKKINSWLSLSKSRASIILAEDWRRLDKLIRIVVTDIFNKKAV